jgi:hypothetical protein
MRFARETADIVGRSNPTPTGLKPMKPPIERTRAGYLLAMLNSIAEKATETQHRVDEKTAQTFFTEAAEMLVAHATEHNLDGRRIENYAEAINQRTIGANRETVYLAVLDAMAGEPNTLTRILD